MSDLLIQALRMLSIGVKRRVSAVLGAFFDDSGTHAKSAVVALGGLLGTDAQWEDFNLKWQAALREPVPGKPPLKQFHLRDCRWSEGEFRDYKPVEREYAIGKFRDIILDVGLVTIAAAVDGKAWRELVTKDIAEEVGDNPLALCFSKCLEKTFETIRFRRPGEKIVIGFDQGTQSELDAWTRLYKSQKENFPELVAMGFSLVSENPSLQGADYIAYNTYSYAESCFKLGENAPIDPIFECFKKRELSCGLIFGREHLSEMVTRVESVLASRSAPSRL